MSFLTVKRITSLGSIMRLLHIPTHRLFLLWTETIMLSLSFQERLERSLI
jgi:hypothetical protein